jgi:zinc/manganese transport system permease protein
MNVEMFQFLAAPMALTLLLVAIHAYLGLHVLARDVIFVDISLSQVAALGVGLSQLYLVSDESPLSIAFALGLCLLVSFLLSLVRRYEKKISQEAVIGITYALASASLILVMDRLPHGAEHLKSSLVGNILFVTWPHVLETFIIYALIGLIHYKYRKQFWAMSKGQSKSFLWDFLFYFLFGVVITFSTHHAGVLVVFAILVVPAALATRFAQTLKNQLAIAWSFGVLGILLAFLLSTKMDWPAGAGIVTTLTASFFVILLGRILYERLR